MSPCELDPPAPTKPSDDWGSDNIMEDPGAEWLSYAAPKFLTLLSELINIYYFLRLPRWCSGKESSCQCRRHKRRRFDPWVRKIPWRRKWQPTPVFLPGKSHGWRSPVGYHPWGHKESTQLSTHTHKHTHCFKPLGLGVIYYTTIDNKNLGACNCCGNLECGNGFETEK